MIKQLHSLLCISMATILVSPLVCSCVKPHNQECKKLLDKNKIEKQYASSHEPSIQNVSIYVENSGSMEGYVNGNTEFKTDLFNIVKLLGETQAVNKNFINSDIFPANISDDQFSNGMSVKTFQELGGNRMSSNIAELIEKVIDSNNEGDLSVFISDCVFDPQSDPDIEKRLAQQKITIQTAIKRKLQSDKEFGVMVYRLMSSFTGTYYNKVKPHSSLNSMSRPYFVWFFGDAYRLKKVRQLLANDVECRTMFQDESQIMVQTNNIPDIPYSCPTARCSKGHGKHIEEPTVKNNKFNFMVRVDYSTLPYNEEYLKDKRNYVIPHNKNYRVTSVHACTKGKDKYTHELKVTKTKGNVKDNTIIEIELKRPSTPDWAVEYNDSLGDDFIKGNRKDRTFGLKSYLDGVHDAFDGSIANFTILIK